MLSRRISGRKIVCQAESSRFRLSRVIFTRLSTAKRVWRGRNGGCKRKRFARPTDRPTPPKGEERDAFQSEIVVQRRLVAPICIMQNNVCENETRRREGGREGRVSSSVGRCSVSSGCNEQNGEFLGEDMYSGLLFFLVTFRLSVDECNISLFFFHYCLDSQVLQCSGIFE